MIPAAPVGGALSSRPAVERFSTVFAIHFPGQRVDAARVVPALLFPLPESLGLFICLPADDGGVGPLDVNLIYLTAIDSLCEGKAGSIGLLAERIADVFFIP